MREMFPGYYHPKDEEFTDLWNTCIFVLDANVLLNLYRYSEKTCNELIGVFEQISNRLWIPHQSAFEYQKNRLTVITQQKEAYKKIPGKLKDNFKSLKKHLENYKRHPYIDINHLFDKINKLFLEIENELDEQSKEYPDFFNNDNIRDKIDLLLLNKLGSAYSNDRLKEIYKEGDIRYKQGIPPGFDDINKDKKDKIGIKKYGDLILWFQLIDYAKEKNKPIILVTDDRKDDWWWKLDGKTIGPRPELIQEIFIKASVTFYMYQADRFMEYAKKYLEHDITEEAIEEIRDIRLRDEDYIYGVQNLAIAIHDAAHLYSLQLATAQQHLKELADNQLIIDQFAATQQHLKEFAASQQIIEQLTATLQHLEDMDDRQLYFAGITAQPYLESNHNESEKFELNNKQENHKDVAEENILTDSESKKNDKKSKKKSETEKE